MKSTKRILSKIGIGAVFAILALGIRASAHSSIAPILGTCDASEAFALYPKLAPPAEDLSELKVRAKWYRKYGSRG
jgi:hypothetical protein